MGGGQTTLEPGDVQKAGREIDLLPAERYRLAHTKTMTVGQHDQGRVPVAVPTTPARGCDELVDFVRKDGPAAKVVKFLRLSRTDLVVIRSFLRDSHHLVTTRRFRRWFTKVAGEREGSVPITMEESMWQRAGLILGRKLMWIVVVALVAGLAWWWRESIDRFVSTNPAKDTAEIVKNYAQALVWLAGGLFFAYKTFSGQNIVCMSLTVTGTRHPIPQSADDYLAITLTLTGGERATIRLHDAQARLFPEDANEEPVKFDLKRMNHTWKEDPGRGIVRWNTTNPRERLLNLAPKESTQLTSYCRVRAERACRIDVVVLGMRRSGLQMGQWRASCFSPPRVAPVAPETSASGQPGVSSAAISLWRHVRSLMRGANTSVAQPAEGEAASLPR